MGNRNRMRATELSLGKRLFFWTLIASLSLTAAIAIGILLFANFDDTTGRILMTTGLVSVTSLLALPGGVLLDQGRYRALAWADLALSSALFVFATVLVWSSSDDPGETLLKAFGTLTIASVATAQVGAVTSRRRDGDPRGVRILYLVSIGLVAVVGAMACTAIWAEIDDGNFYRILAALVVADVFSVIVQPILKKMSPARRDGVFRLAFTLDRDPGDEAIEGARRALQEAGANVERTERGR